MADAPLVIANHRAGAFHPMQIFTHTGGSFHEAHIYQLPADLTVVTPPPPSSATITLTSLLGAGETLGTANDSVIMARCLRKGFGRTGAAAVHMTTVNLTVDFQGNTYFCEDPMSFTDFRLRAGRNWKTILHGNVANPAVKGGFKQATTDGIAFPKANVVSTGGPEGDDRVSSGGDGHTTPKARNRECMEFTNCSYITFQSFSFVGSNTIGSGPGFYYDVQREAQHFVELIGSINMRFVDCDISRTFGDVIWMTPVRPAGGGKVDDIYCGNIEALGGDWYKIGRIYITMNQVRAPDGVINARYYWNPADGSGPNEGGVSSLPAANDAPSQSGTHYGVWWHGNAAHPFTGRGCKRSVIDIENITSFAHCCDVTLGADTESTVAVDQANFHLTGEGKNLISGINGWGLIQRFVISRLWRTGSAGMSIRIHGSPGEGFIGVAKTGFIDATMNGVATNPMPSTVRLTAMDPTWPATGYMQTNVGIFGSGVPIIVRYTGKSGLNLTGCTYHYGDNTKPFIGGRSVTQRFAKPERPSYVCSGFVMVDSKFDGSNASLLDLERVANSIIQRNRANYRIANKPNEIHFEDCPGLNLGGPGEYGNNDFRGV